jgi:hypothetical protein
MADNENQVQRPPAPDPTTSAGPLTVLGLSSPQAPAVLTHGVRRFLALALVVRCLTI